MARRDGYFIVVLFALTLAAYANSFHAPFILDDIHTIVRNFGLRDLSDLVAVFTYDYAGRPFLFLTFALNFAVGELNPFGYHIVNFALHFSTSILVYLVLIDIFKRADVKGAGYAAFGALLFALHPLNVETVTYLSSRSSGLCTFLYLLSFYLAAKSGDKKWYRYPIATVAFILALFTKELAVTLPFLLTLFIFQFEGWQGLAKKKSLLAIFWMMLPLFFLYRALAIGHPIEAPDVEAVTRPSVITYFFTQLDVVGTRYLPRLFLPVNLLFDAGILFKKSFFDPRVFGGAILLFGLFGYAIKSFRTNRPLSFGILWFFITLSITSSFIPILDPYVEHRLYIALPGFCLALAAAAERFFTKFPSALKSAPVAAGVVVIIFGSLTFARNHIFRSPRMVWEDTISKSWGKSRVYVGLAYDYIKTGEFQKAEEVLRFGRKAFEDRVDIQLALCWTLGAQGKFAAMEQALSQIMPAKRREWADYYHFKGLIEGQKGDARSAMEFLKKALEYNPSHVDATANIAILLLRSGKSDEAVNWLREAILKNPYEADYHFNLGNILLDSDKAEAMSEYQTALKLDPFHHRAKKALQAIVD